jgi:hypothetical protein
MNKITNFLLIFFILLAGSLSGQTRFCEQEVCVVEFNANWNKANSVDWLDSLENCGVARVNIGENQITQSQQEDYNITVVPTIIVFNGVEVKRFQSCLRFKMGATQEEVQAVVNEILR